jgi:hypothetical protein
MRKVVMAYDQTEILGATEILGEDELDLLLGDDDYDDDEILELGRRLKARRRGGRGRKPSRSMVSRAIRQPMAVESKAPTKGRELALGFDSVANVAAAGTVAVNSNPQQVFAPERIAIPATIAPNFIVNSLTIGTAIQFLNAVPIHAETFGTTAPDVRLKMDTAQINSVITFNVTNLSAVALRFFATLLGPSVS